jgi:peptidoglycan/xylan/chitin deacetylase (PgdA/CDA1 family)
MTKEFNQSLVLMYHGIVTEWTSLPEEREAGADLYDVPSGNFHDQLNWLKEQGYSVDILNQDRSNADTRRVILTFDDGEMNNYEQALPILQKFSFPAYFFIIAKRVGRPGYMGWDELRAMRDAGMVIGSHGFSHEILTSLLDTQIEEELSASKKYLERNLDIVVDTISIPRGFCNDKIIQMAYEAGYKNIFISDRPKNLQASCTSRLAVKTGWTLQRFQQALEGTIPFNERALWKIKNMFKSIFGGGVYDWVRRVLLKIK